MKRGGQSCPERVQEIVRPHEQHRYSVLGTRYCELIDYSLISDLQPAIDDLKRLAHLLFVDAERRVGEEGVPADEGVEPLLAEETSERRHFVGGAVEGSQ